ncbi:hypothetical protein [Rhizobium leguminosarum]|uniref:hypothetical protein n=1 Tax=Rhizobium leguminosarum TaxID=384 RepID=UPI00144106AE|nr:hypothetical protein [Rhizobium leguminosarum]NKK42714.1 hypothetical protein [Rhizobium leguminosarum bv. viciae]
MGTTAKGQNIRVLEVSPGNRADGGFDRRRGKSGRRGALIAGNGKLVMPSLKTLEEGLRSLQILEIIISTVFETCHTWGDKCPKSGWKTKRDIGLFAKISKTAIFFNDIIGLN